MLSSSFYIICQAKNTVSKGTPARPLRILIMTNKYSSIVADRIVRQVYEKAPSGVGGHMLTVVVYTILSYSLVDQTTLLMWALLQTIILAGRAYLVVQFRRVEKTLPKPATWLNYYIIGAGITGALWGIVIYLPATTMLHIFLPPVFYTPSRVPVCLR